MSLFGNLKNDGLEETQDRLGGFQPLKTNIYTGPIKLAYAGQSAGGARSITLIVDVGTQEYRETQYITNKKGENFFLNKDDRTKKVPLPGFSTIDDICLVTTGIPLADQEAEEKMVKVYDAETKKELPKSVPVLTGLLGKVVSLGIIQTLENKSVKQGDEYIPTAETRNVNTIDKVWHTETQMTVAEARAGASKGAFWDAWLERNKDQVRDKRTIKDGEVGQAQSGRPGANRNSSGPPAAGSATTQRKSLFGAKSAA